MMQRTTRTFSIEHIKGFKQNLLSWSQQFETALWLDSNNYWSFDASKSSMLRGFVTKNNFNY